MSDSDVVIRVEGLGKKYSLHNANRNHVVVLDLVSLPLIEAERKGNYLEKILGAVRPNLTWTKHQLTHGAAR